MVDKDMCAAATCPLYLLGCYMAHYTGHLLTHYIYLNYADKLYNDYHSAFWLALGGLVQVYLLMSWWYKCDYVPVD